jgi:outer membrane protein OmpA-like peptidoglycan-associated protein
MNLRRLPMLLLLGAASAHAEPAPRVPLVPGLLIVGVIGDQRGDYEGLVKVERIDDRAVRLLISDDLPVAKPCPTCAKFQRLVAHRNVLKEDLDKSHQALIAFRSGADETYPGYTAVQISREMVTELRDKGETAFDKSLVLLGPKVAKVRDDLQTIRQKHFGASPDEKRLRIIDRPALSVLVNGREVALPTLHAGGRFGGFDSEWWFLDDPDNALVLASASNLGAKPNLLGLGGESRTRAVRISFPDAAATAPVAQTLEKEGRAEVDGIFFDFASDVVRAESEPALAEVAAALTKHPGWKITIAGHTDNVGGDAYNLDLSRRRAVAVRAALVARYGIPAERLATEGLGASEPKASNDTPVGRARNRRVELVRAP